MSKICSKCGKQSNTINNVHTELTHHIKLFKDYPELRLDEDNVAVLSRVCNLQIGDSSVVA